MAATIGSLAVRVGADTSGLVKGLKDSSNRLDQFGSKIRSGATDFAKYGAAATAAGAAMATALAVKGLKSVDAQAKLARQLGATIDGLRGLHIAASEAGVSSQVMDRALERLNARIGEARRGTGSAAESFQRLGLDAEALSGMDVDQRLATIADQMQRLGLSSDQVADELRQMGIRQGEVVNLMAQGGDAIRKARQDVDDYGLALSEVDAAKVEAANDAFARATRTLDAVSQQLAVEVAPLLDAMSRMFSDAAKDAGGFGEATSGAFEFVVDAAAFVMDAVAGIQRVFVAAGKTVAAFGLGVKEVMLTVADYIINLPVRAANQLIDTLNRIPGMPEVDPIKATGLGQEIYDELQEVRRAGQIAMDDIHQTFMEPLPGNQFKEFVAQAREASQAAAEEAVAVQRTLAGGNPEDGGSTVGLSEDDREKLADKMNALREANLTEIELLREKHELELEELARAEEAKIELDGTYKELREETERRHQDELNNIEKQAAKQRQQIAEQELRAREATTGQILGNITTLMNTESRKMFEIGKAAGIANSIISTYTGASKALELGWPLGPVAAAAITAKGFAQVSAIRSQSFKGGGGASGSATQSVNDNSTPIAASGASSERSVSINVGLIGGNDRDRALAGGLLDQINEEIERGGRISRVGLA